MHKRSKIFVAGHAGMVGSAILRRLRRAGYENVFTRARTELDLTDQRQVKDYLSSIQPDYIIIAAARVGGIEANNATNQGRIFVDRAS